MRAVFLTLAALAVIAAADVPQVPKMVVIFGVKKPGGAGNASCSDIDTLDQTAVDSWITGYFSGQNVAGTRVVGARLGSNAFIGIVRKVCSNKPSAPFSWVVQNTYETLQRQQL
jgi:hypothetical protein